MIACFQITFDPSGLDTPVFSSKLLTPSGRLEARFELVSATRIVKQNDINQARITRDIEDTIERIRRSSSCKQIPDVKFE